MVRGKVLRRLVAPREEPCSFFLEHPVIINALVPAELGHCPAPSVLVKIADLILEILSRCVHNLVS